MLTYADEQAAGAIPPHLVKRIPRNSGTAAYALRMRMLTYADEQAAPYLRIWSSVSPATAKPPLYSTLSQAC
jgi:hypothetical protein